MSIRTKVAEASDIWQQLSKYDSLLSSSSTLRSKIEAKISEWSTLTNRRVILEFPFLESDAALQRLKNLDWENKTSPNYIQNSLHNYMDLCGQVGQPQNEKYWSQIFCLDSKPARRKPAVKKIDKSMIVQLEEQWQKTLDQAHIRWETEYIRKLREELIDELLALLSQIDQISHYLETFGLEKGLFFDLSIGNLQQQDINKIKRWAKYLSEDEGVRALCDLLGKMRQHEKSERLERALFSTQIDVQRQDSNSKEEIVGVRHGRELEHVLPSELALLADPETEVLFDLKYHEAALMCFDMQGIQNSKEVHEIEQDTYVSEQDKLGPVVICVDTSGSMQGAPEIIAKAVTLYITAKAKEQQRPCYLINFSTSIETFDFSENYSLKNLLDFLEMSFHGGTDVTPALSHALDTLETDRYEKADVLVISDFIMSSLPETMMTRIDAQRKIGSRFNSLVVGDALLTKPLGSLFDNEWIFNPFTSNVENLIATQEMLDNHLRPTDSR